MAKKSKTAIPTQAEYEAREAKLHAAHLREIEEAPLRDRQDARESFRRAMVEAPEIVGERIGWMFQGAYGFGVCAAAKKILGEKRLNKVAALSQLVAAVEWMCPQAFAIAAWKSLSAKQQRVVDKQVRDAIKDADPAV